MLIDAHAHFATPDELPARARVRTVFCGVDPESAALALKNGCDLNCGNTYLHLLEALQEGLVTEDQITAEAILEDIYSGALKDFDENKTLAEYIEIYNRNTLRANIEKFSAAFGFDKDKLSRIMVFHLTEDNLLQTFGRHVRLRSLCGSCELTGIVEQQRQRTDGCLFVGLEYGGLGFCRFQYVERQVVGISYARCRNGFGYNLFS